MSEENKIEEENTKKLPVKKRYIFTSLACLLYTSDAADEL